MRLFGNLKQERWRFLFLIFLLYFLRLLYCYCGYLKNHQWLDDSDESHIYLLGLDFFITKHFPLWGADIVYSHSRIPGGLLGLLIGIPLFLWHHPFAPYLFLFIIQSISLIYLSSYLSKLFPQIPEWVIYCIITFAPFTLHTGLKIINPAYVLVFSVPFILSFIESLKLFKQQFIAPRWRYFWLSFSSAAVFQLHPSYVVMFILWMIALVFTLLENPKSFQLWVTVFGISFFGFALGILSLIPTINHYGLTAIFNQGKNINFRLSHITWAGALVFYFITLCGYFMNEFCAVYHWENLWHNISVLSGVDFIIIQVCGILVFILQLLIFFFKGANAYIKKYRRFLLTFLFILSGLIFIYMFSITDPLTHAIIIFFPVSVIYLCFCLQFFMDKGLKRTYIAVFFSLVALYYLSIVKMDNILPDMGYRAKVNKAINDKNPSEFETLRYPNYGN